MEKAIKINTNYQAILFPLLDVLLNGGNLLIHLYISWFLSTGQYGILGAFFSLLFVLMIIGMSMQTYFAKRVSSKEFSIAEIHKINDVSIWLTLATIILLLALTIPMTNILRGTTTQYLMIVATFAVQSRLSYYRGYIQGKKAFLKLNISFYIEMAVKLAVLIPLMKTFKNVDIALLSVLIGISASLLTTRYSMKKQLEMDNLKMPKFLFSGSADIYKGFLKVFSTQFYFYYFTAVVLIFTNYYMGEASGLYAVSTRYGQIFIHIGLSIITVFIPYISEIKDSQKAFKTKVIKLLLLYTGIGLLLLAGYSVIMPLAIKYLFTEAYQGAAAIVIPQAFGYYVLSIAFYMASMEMVSGSKEYIATLTAFSVILMIALMKWHTSLTQIVAVEVTVYSLMAAVLIIRFLMRRERND